MKWATQKLVHACTGWSKSSGRKFAHRKINIIKHHCNIQVGNNILITII